MKRFKNILAIYDLGIGAEETLDKAIDLARQNEADLKVLHVLDVRADYHDLIQERKKLMNRLLDGINLEKTRFDVIVRSGDLLSEAVSCVENEQIDLIVAPTQYGNGWAQLLGTDLTAELMRHTLCPIWVVRPGGEKYYRKIVAAVNAGKKNASQCPINKRILEMAASLAEREGADLDVLYAWEFSKEDKERLLSELPDHVRYDISQNAHFKAQDALIAVKHAILGSDHKSRAVVRYGDMEDAVLDYLKQSGADLLVSEGLPGNPLVNAFMGNRTLRLLNQSNCSVLISRPKPQHNMIKTLSGHPYRGVELTQTDRVLSENAQD
ncbi:MAG: universal stress protein [Methylocystaceae bacterium]|nr:universal stress protein [Methylocystaceae bacterium]